MPQNAQYVSSQQYLAKNNLKLCLGQNLVILEGLYHVCTLGETLNYILNDF